MIRMADMSKRLRPMLPTALGICVVGYFVYHAIQGEHGLLAWRRLAGELAASEATLAALSGQRAVLEHRVALLSPQSLDLDLLEEQARLMLNVAAPEDRLIIVPVGDQR